MTEALGQSDAFIFFQEQISKVAPIERPVLILGERGTGKELAASRLHFLSKRWEKPFVTLNCSVLTPTLIGSELFGYEKGAFTGAQSRQMGRFEQASSGTLFLDEIGTIPMEVQEKILRAVEYGHFERVGASKSIQVDVRIIAATNANLAQMAGTGQFKQDLLDRLSFEVIHVPPLRMRKGDIKLLADHFAARMAFEMGRDEIPTLSTSALNSLEKYPWPGNIRELKNVVERAVYKASSNKIEQIFFDPFVNPYQDDLSLQTVDNTARSQSVEKEGRPTLNFENGLANDALEEFMQQPLKLAIANMEKQMINQALKKCRFNQKKAAQALGLTYDQFRGLKRKYDI